MSCSKSVINALVGHSCWGRCLESSVSSALLIGIEFSGVFEHGADNIRLDALSVLLHSTVVIGHLHGQAARPVSRLGSCTFSLITACIITLGDIGCCEILGSTSRLPSIGS